LLKENIFHEKLFPVESKNFARKPVFKWLKATQRLIATTFFKKKCFPVVKTKKCKNTVY